MRRNILFILLGLFIAAGLAPARIAAPAYSLENGAVVQKSLLELYDPAYLNIDGTLAETGKDYVTQHTRSVAALSRTTGKPAFPANRRQRGIDLYDLRSGQRLAVRSPGRRNQRRGGFAARSHPGALDPIGRSGQRFLSDLSSGQRLVRLCLKRRDGRNDRGRRTDRSCAIQIDGCFGRSIRSLLPGPNEPLRMAGLGRKRRDSRNGRFPLSDRRGRNRSDEQGTDFFRQT